MLKRKLIAALITFILSTLCIALISPTPNLIEDLRVSGLIVLWGVLFYLLPVTFLIEWITRKASFARFALSFYLHILFGFLTIFFLFFLFFYSMIVFFIFFLTDELLRILDKKGPHKLRTFILRPFKRLT
ncbi:hypothetical protein [Alkalicoccobacillus murimartini]|uniref:Glucan phosphoethanolaminetransferase (Alkaline phosphatase superfamily) n=1 Tax=Alkalicoccobacillus murimartini TaxID=171685 RepID=A0ABT9YMH1_9BACI|nr:hypothetical protein [Alkalicoccobacillus murimartini]MDQ0209077.1 glucan phosphoethanolaminetransferase (alkaline phosphatase superfamily) [Alkalicoccobacillus murimartini]